MSVSALLLVAAAMVLLSSSPPQAHSQKLLVGMTLVRNASAIGAYCLDGSSPAYHLHRGFGAGADNWLLQFEGGGWCNDVETCLDRAKSRRGSTRYMSKYEVFSGILSDNASLNPDFYNWNRVKLRYCDGASFAGDGQFNNGTSLLYFRGQKIWEAIILDLLPKGLGNASKALLSGCSAGGLSVFLHCDSFTRYLPANASVKCLSDAGFFLDARDISSNYTMRSFFKSLVFLQVPGFSSGRPKESEHQLHKLCSLSQSVLLPTVCIEIHHDTHFHLELRIRCLPGHFAPFCSFKLNASSYSPKLHLRQFHHILVPPSADPRGHWNRCKLDPAACDASQIQILQGFRSNMIGVLLFFLEYSRRGGMFINSCFAHCQSESQDTWFAPDSPRIHNKTIAEAVGDWYFSRGISKEIDCPYPCDHSCHNLIPAASGTECRQPLGSNYVLSVLIMGLLIAIQCI